MTAAQTKLFEDMNQDQKDFVGAMLEELVRAEKKHGDWPEDAVHAAAILSEEAGKLTQASIDYEYHPALTDAYERMVKRAISTAAMGMRYWHGLATY